MTRTRIIFQCEKRQLAKYERAAKHRDLTLSAWIRHVLDGASIAFAEKRADYLTKGGKRSKD